jgi:hypothetical protein
VLTYYMEPFNSPFYRYERRVGSALYTQVRSSNLPIPTLRFSCYELGTLF